MSRRSFIGSISFWNKQIVRATRKQPLSTSELLARSIRPVIESLEQRTLLSTDPALQLDVALPYLPDTPLAPAPVLPQGMMAAGLTVPIYHSNPSATAKIYLDFDGYAAMNWGGTNVTATPAYSIDTDTANFSATELANIQEIWERVSEKYAMFNVDVTTQDPGNLNNLQTVVAVIGGDGAWLGQLAGGVAYLGSFSNSSPNQVWIFPKNLAAGDPQSVGEATAHEVGHAFGLLHQSAWSGTTKTEYNPGDAYRAPIMGVSYYAVRGLWWNGTSSTSSTSIQDDLSILAGATNGFGYRVDDTGSTTSTAGTLTLNGGSISASGVIGSTSDADWFVLDIPSTGPVSITLTGPRGAMLDSTLGLNLSDGSSWFSNDGDGVGEYLGGTLNAGRYYLVVRSHGGYGDIGKYTISGTIPSLQGPTALTATAVNPSQINLAWVANAADNESGYKIERSTDGVNWTQIIAVGPNVTSYQDTGLRTDSPYSYRVRAFTSTENSPYTNTISARTLVSSITFAPPTSSGLGSDTYIPGLAMHDLNGDGVKDIVAVNNLERTLVIRLGNGNGTFQAMTTYPLLADAGAVAVGDLNADGKVDLAVAQGGDANGSIGVMFGNGDGTFQTRADYAVGPWPNSVFIGDMNRDGIADMIVGNGGSHPAMSILHGWGDGTFTNLGPISPIADFGSLLAMGNFNGDTVPDFVVSSNSGTVAIAIGSSNGYFGKPAVIVGDGGLSVAIGDFNADGKTDVAVAISNLSLIRILLGNGDGTLSSGASYTVSYGYAELVATGDFNGDGRMDLVTGGYAYGGAFLILPGRGDGTFEAATSYSVISFNGVKVDDLNGDGKDDLAIVDGLNGSIQVFLNTTPFVPTSPSGLRSFLPDSTRINIAWTDNAANETGYRIERSSDGATWAEVAVVGAGVVSYLDTGLTPETSYYYRVRAYNTAGSSAYSGTITASTAPTPPDGLTAATYSSTQINLSWTDRSTTESGFKIERSTDGVNWTRISIVAANVTTYVDPNLAAGTQYYYRVLSYNTAGDSTPSGVASAVTAVAPAAPSALTAAAVSMTQINLAWTDNSTDEAGFRIERSTNGGSTWTQIATVGAGVTTYNNTGLTAATSYSYRVCAYNSTNDNSVYSNVSSATTLVGNPPAIPSGLTAIVFSTSQINLTWNDNSSDETGFKIERSTDGGSTWTQLTTLAANMRALNNAGLAAGATYSYRVCSYNANGTSAPSNVVTATTYVLPAPTGATATVVNSTSVQIRWTDTTTTETGFTIWELGPWGGNYVPVATVAANVTTYTRTALIPDTSYSYYVTATSAAGACAPSNIVTARTTYLPAAPSALTATAISNYQINLAWTDNSTNESGFKIERSSDGGATWSQIGTTAANIRTYNNTGLAGGTAYAYRVRGYNSTQENGAWSNVITATTFSNPPTAPTLLTATVISTSQINLAWSETATDESGFKIERSADGGASWTQVATVGPNIKTYNNTGLSAGTSYSYRVMSYNAVATSLPTNTASGTTWAATPPTIGTATVLSSTSIRVAWTDASNNESGFKIEASTNGGTTWSQVATSAANTTSYTLTGLTGNTSYRFRVKAYTALGDSPASAASTAVTTTYLPAAPSALTATVISNYQINLAWTDNSANESGFKIERSSDGGANWTQVGTVGVGIRAYNNTGLNFGTAYSYRVCAYNSTNENGAYSNVISATTLSNPPVAPSALTATVISTSQINLAWSDNSSDETGFRVERSADGGANWTLVTTLGIGIKTYSNTGLAAGTTYAFRVSAVNAAATSAPTNVATGTTWAAMPPTTVTATVLLSTSTRVNWVDASNNESGFKIEASSDGGTTWTQVGTAAANTTTCTVTGLTGNTSYRFRVKAYTALGDSPASTASTAVTTTYLPAAPSALTATVISNYQINLAWADNSTNENGFRIERSADGGATWSPIATVGIGIKAYNNTGLTFGTTYSYRVCAYNTTNENGAYSNVVVATTFSNPPIAPTTLTATVISTSQINLAWADKSSDETGFKIERSSDGGANWTQIAAPAANATTYSATGLAAGTAYSFRVLAYNAAATSVPTNVATGTTWAAMPPTIGTATVLASTSIKVNWTDASNNETGFKIEASTDGGTTWTQVATAAANTATCTVTGLTGNTSYRFRVKAYTALGDSPASAASTAVTTTYLPAAPSALTATVISNYQINLAWTDNSLNESGFKIERSADGGTTWTQIATTLANIRTYNNTGLSFGTPYSYRVRGYNSTAENGAFSNVATATTFSNPPTAPTLLTATVTSTSQINLAWTDNSSDETGFKIERSTDGGSNWTLVTTVGVGIKTYNNTGLAAGTSYSYRVSAVNTAATSAPTNVVAATTWAAMPPTTVTATAVSSTSIRVNWVDASNNETGFTLWEKGPWAGNYLPVASVAANTVTYTRSGLEANTAYSYYLTATTALGQSPNSAVANATTTYLPAAPSALTATVISNYQINLAWTDNSANESGFKIERSADGGTTWTQIATTLTNIRTYNNTGLSFGTPYSYRVRGYNATNENGAWSNTISATTFSNPPAVPTGLSATVASSTQVNLAWTDTSSDETGFNIQQSTDGGVNWVKIATAAANAKTYSVTGLAPGSSYGFRVRSANAAATSAPSNAVSVTTFYANAPTNPTATVLSSTSIRINWTDTNTNESGFKLEQSTDAGLTWSLVASPAANALTHTLTGLTPNTAYRYRLRAVTAAGESPNSAVVSITTPYLPAAPSALTATAYSATQINLAWTDNSANEASFRVERSGDGGATWTQITSTAANVRSYNNNTGLLAGSSYSYRVRAANSANEYSAFSNTVTATTLPAAPTGFTATALAGRQIRLNWSNLSGESGYLIERSLNSTTWTQIASVAADTITFTDTGLTAGTRYFYRIRAYNPSGNGAYSTPMNTVAIA